MGTAIYVVETRFRVHRTNFADAHNALQFLKGQETCGTEGDKHFAWVSNEAWNNAETLEETLSAWRWEPEKDDEGNICDLLFTGEKLGDESLLFEHLAPHVAHGSFISIVDDEAKVWRWLFDCGKLLYQHGRLVFETEQ